MNELQNISSNQEFELNSNESHTPKLEKDKLVSIADSLELYLGSLRGIALTAQIALPHISNWALSELKKTQKNIEKFIPDAAEGENETKSIAFDSARDFAEFFSTARKLEELRSFDFPAVLATSLFTQLFAEFDSYIGNLLKAIYLKNDNLLKGISREISLSDLLDFEDINAVKLSMLNKEIDTFRRDSYIEQFSTLEKKFNLTLKRFKEWPEFVELSQRRNILTHNGGLISDQYLIVCEKEGYEFEKKYKIGDQLPVTFEYFNSANRLLSKIGLMLAYTLWNKIFPKEIDEIHASLNNTIFDCLNQKRWKFVAELEDFVLSEKMKSNISEVALRVRIVNIAIGLKFSGHDSKAISLINSVDWSASYRDFKLAIAVLKENWGDAVEIMKSIGKSGEIITQPDYHTWPLFTKFREQSEFYQAYYKIYDEHFSEKVSTNQGDVEAHAKSAESKNLITAESDPLPKKKAKSQKNR